MGPGYFCRPLCVCYITILNSSMLLLGWLCVCHKNSWCNLVKSWNTTTHSDFNYQSFNHVCMFYIHVAVCWFKNNIKHLLIFFRVVSRLFLQIELPQQVSIISEINDRNTCNVIQPDIVSNYRGGRYCILAKYHDSS